MPGCYLKKEITKYINNEKVKVIFEIGSRDCLDAINLYKHYNVKVYAFECNPLAIKICKENLKKYDIKDDQVELIEKAIYNEDGEITFYPVDKTVNAETFENHVDFVKIDENTSANIGASSLFKINKDYQQLKYKNKDYHQQNTEVKVQSIRLDNFIKERNIDRVDLICMDLQGAELMAFQGMGKHLKDVRYIITELCTSVEKNGKIIENYDGQGNIEIVFNLLKKSNFHHLIGNKLRFSHNDFFFININEQ
jgi:FkbM family methyltransferase